MWWFPRGGRVDYNTWVVYKHFVRGTGDRVVLCCVIYTHVVISAPKLYWKLMCVTKLLYVVPSCALCYAIYYSMLLCYFAMLCCCIAIYLQFIRGSVWESEIRESAYFLLATSLLSVPIPLFASVCMRWCNMIWGKFLECVNVDVCFEFRIVLWICYEYNFSSISICLTALWWDVLFALFLFCRQYSKCMQLHVAALNRAESFPPKVFIGKAERGYVWRNMHIQLEL